MAQKTVIPLPVAPKEYSSFDQGALRLTLENSIGDLHIDIGNATKIENKPSSLALKRHQFLLMGSSGG